MQTDITLTERTECEFCCLPHPLIW